MKHTLSTLPNNEPLAANAKPSIAEFIAGKIESERLLIKEASKPVCKFVFTFREILEVRYTGWLAPWHDANAVKDLTIWSFRGVMDKTSQASKAERQQATFRDTCRP